MTLKEKRHNYYVNLTQEQIEQRRIYQRDFMRRKRAAARAARDASVNSRSQSPSPETKIAPTPTVDLAKCEKEISPRKAQKIHRVWRSSLIDYVTDCLTEPACPMAGAEFESHRITAMFMGWFNKLDQIEAAVDDKPDLLAELRLSIAVECLRRLSGETPAGMIVIPGRKRLAAPPGELLCSDHGYPQQPPK